MSNGGRGAYEEHHFRRIIPGDVAAVRSRLCAVLEDFNYIVLSDTPIQARRDKTRNFLVSTILDCEGRHGEAVAFIRFRGRRIPKHIARF